jgi:antirestriction protein ArdC
MAQDIYQTVTDQIVAAIEQGADKWVMPWHNNAASDSPMPFNVSSKRHYRGVNTLALWAAGQSHGYTSSAWGTYRQWGERGGQVRKGERSTSICFWKFSERAAPTEDDADATKASAMARAYSVFNAGQVDGYEAPASIVLPEVTRIANAEAFIANLGAEIRHGGGRAFYSPSTDHIQMPEAAAFRDMISYYATTAHEATHWTSHSTRCDRSQNARRFGDDAYAAEELIAELGSAYCCAILGLANEPRPDHAQYLASWLKVLKADKRAIFTAASGAQKAVDWMVAKQPADTAETHEENDFAMAA